MRQRLKQSLDRTECLTNKCVHSARKIHARHDLLNLLERSSSSCVSLHESNYVYPILVGPLYSLTRAKLYEQTLAAKFPVPPSSRKWE